VPVIVAVTLALVTAVLFALPRSAGDAGRDGSSSQQPPARGEAGDRAGNEAMADQARRIENDPMAIGEVDAPVVLVNYSEFQCPFCGKFARDTKPTLVRDYVAKGILRIEWRDFPYLGAESRTAANAARAAAAQGKFWEFHDAMFASQQPPNSGRLTAEYLAGVAKSVGVDVTRFAADMGSDETDKAVTKDFGEGQAIGVTGTPAFLVNGRPIIGAQPTEEFVAAIEQAAKSATP
jgi:protein-disulfide isomerase